MAGAKAEEELELGEDLDAEESLNAGENLSAGKNLNAEGDLDAEENSDAGKGLNTVTGAEIVSKMQKLQRLPAEFDAEKFALDFYGEITLKPRPMEYAPLENPGDTLTVADLIKQDEDYAGTVTPKYYLRAGEGVFAERGDMIRIDAACALAGSGNAYAEGGPWRHCCSESYGRSGLAMYIGEMGNGRAGCNDAPSLHYRIQCQGGEYVLWLLLKFGKKEEFDFCIGIDGRALQKEEFLGRGSFWRYEAEQIYRYLPVVRLALTEGGHLLSIYAKAAGLRFDRICLVKGDALPPMDSEWA